MRAKKRKTFARAPVHFSERRDPKFLWAAKHAAPPYLYRTDFDNAQRHDPSAL